MTIVGATSGAATNSAAGEVQLENRGLLQSLAMKGERELLKKLADDLKVPILFLKAAWSDPVLYGGRGARHGTDIDVLVPTAAFSQFASALTSQGFFPASGPPGARGEYFKMRERSFIPPAGSAYLTVDLHQSLGDDCWVEYPTEPLFARSRFYDSPHGLIRSLSVEDQIVYACVHHTVHAFDLDDRHATDIAKITEKFSVDWDVVLTRAQEAGQLVALALLAESLQLMGVTIPCLSLPRSIRLRAMLARTLMGRSGPVSRSVPRSRLLDYFAVRPLLSDDLLAAPRFAFRHAVPWVFDRFR